MDPFSTCSPVRVSVDGTVGWFVLAGLQPPSCLRQLVLQLHQPVSGSPLLTLVKIITEGAGAGLQPRYCRSRARLGTIVPIGSADKPRGYGA